MSSLSPLAMGFFALVMTGAFAVRGAAGFGAVLIAVPMLAFIVPVSTAVSVTTALTALTSLHQVSRHWHRVAWRQFGIMSLFTMIGVVLGFYFLHVLDEHALRRCLGAFLIIYSIYALRTAGNSPMLPRHWRVALAMSTGIVGGLFGTLFGAGSGPIYVIYFNVLRLEKEVFRVTMSTVMLLGGLARIVGYFRFGFYEGSTLGLFVLGLPLIVVGSWLGDRLLAKLDPRRFRWLVGGLLMLSGAALLIK